MNFLILFTVIQLAYCQYISEFPCPSRPVMRNFDIKRIAGTWYNVMQYEDTYAATFLCGHGNYSVIDDYTVKVHECEIQRGKYSCLTGIISVNDPNHVRKEAKTSYAYYHEPSVKVDEFKYLDVDYDEYAVVYECKDKPKGESVHSLWIASRTPILSDYAKRKVDKLIDEHFDKDAIHQVVQDKDVCEPRNVN